LRWYRKRRETELVRSEARETKRERERERERLMRQ